MNERQAARAGTVKGVPQAADVESASLSDRRSSAYDEVQAGLVERFSLGSYAEDIGVMISCRMAESLERSSYNKKRPLRVRWHIAIHLRNTGLLNSICKIRKRQFNVDETPAAASTRLLFDMARQIA